MSSERRVTLEVGDSQRISARRITAEDLEAVDAELRRFSSPVSWSIKDEQGEHSGDDLSIILENLIWSSVETFNCSADLDDASENPFDNPHVHVSTSAGEGLYLSWRSSVAQGREEAERTYRKIAQQLNQLPGSPQNVYTTKAAEERLRAEEANRWWRRAGRNTPGWTIALLIGIVGSIIGGIILFLVFDGI